VGLKRAEAVDKELPAGEIEAKKTIREKKAREERERERERKSPSSDL